MQLTIYKPGQGYWTRVCSAVGAGILVLAGVRWLAWEQGATWHLYVKLGVALGALAGVGFALFVLFNKPKVVDFLIATEHEMKKVSWPTRKEIIGSTAVVICGTFAFSLLMFVIDFVFAWLFQAIRIIEIG